MTDLTSAPSASTPARDELARQLLAVVLPPNQRLSDELDFWLSLIAGAAGHLHCAFDESHFYQRDFIGSADQVAALAGLLEKSTRIARVLAASVREGGQ